MAVIWESDTCVVLDHLKLLQSWATQFPQPHGLHFDVGDELFEIKTPFLMNAQAAKRARLLLSTSSTDQLPSGYPEGSNDVGELAQIYIDTRNNVEIVRRDFQMFDEKLTAEEVEANNKDAMATARNLLQSELADSLTRKTWVFFLTIDRNYIPEGHALK